MQGEGNGNPLSTLAWKIPWTEEPARLQSMGSLQVRHELAASLSLFIFRNWRKKWQATPVFFLGGSQGWRRLVVCHLWVAQSWTCLKWLSSSSRNMQNKNCCCCSVTKLCTIWLFVTSWTAACQGSLPSPSFGFCSNSCPLSQWCI